MRSFWVWNFFLILCVCDSLSGKNLNVKRRGEACTEGSGERKEGSRSRSEEQKTLHIPFTLSALNFAPFKSFPLSLCIHATMPGPAPDDAPGSAPPPAIVAERGRSAGGGGGAATPSGAMREEMLRARAAVRSLQRRSSTLSRRAGEDFMLPSVVDAEVGGGVGGDGGVTAPLLAVRKRFFCSSS